MNRLELMHDLSLSIYELFFFVPWKVRFLAMTMFEQARLCSLGLTKTVLFRSSKSAFSRHDNVRASSTLFIWLNENCSFLVPRKVRFLAMTMSEQARHCSFGLTKTFFSRSLKSAFSRHANVRTNSTLFIWLNENVGKYAKSNRETSR